MLKLKKETVIVKDSIYDTVEDAGSIYRRVRVQNEGGKTAFFKELIVPRYVGKSGAMKEGVPRTWYIKNITKKKSVVIAHQKTNGEVDFDLDEVKVISRSFVLVGVYVGVAALPASIIIATATFGFGLLLFPVFLYMAYRNIFKIAPALSRATLEKELRGFGVNL